MRRTSRVPGAVFGLLVAALLPLNAGAQKAAETAPAPPPEYQVNFRADRVDIEAESAELRLSGRVVVTVSRYRIESEKLSLARGPRGLEVRGSGEVALCPCEDAPITLGFQAATVAPPTDVLLEQPTVRVGGVPVFWLPYLWLRARDRLGLLPPWVEWRGEDGLLVGGGAHLPLGGRSYRQRASALDLRAASYLEGGVRVDALVDASASRTRVVWDHLEQTALRVESSGSSAIGDAAHAAWSADALRGARARRDPSSLDQSARRYDRAALTVAHAGALSAGLGVQATDTRGGELDDVGVAGPRLHLGGGGELGAGSFADAGLDVTSLRLPAGHRSDVRGELELEFEAPAAPLAIGADVRQRVLFRARDGGGESALEHGLFPRVSLPLVRRFGELSHYVEPVLSGGHLLAERSAPSLPGSERWPGQSSLLGGRGQQLWVAGAGLGNAFGSARRSLSLFVGGGFVGSDELKPGVGAELSSDFDWLGLSVRGATYDDRAMSVARARLGRSDGLHLGARADASTAGGSAEAQWLLPDAWESSSAWLLERGLSVGGDAGVPWTSWLSSQVGADYDATSARLLGVDSSLAYSHPCGCLSATAWAGHRLGRGGFDAWLSVDLLP